MLVRLRLIVFRVRDCRFQFWRLEVHSKVVDYSRSGSGPALFTATHFQAPRLTYPLHSETHKKAKMLC